MARLNHSCGGNRKAAGAEAEKVASAGQVHRGTCLGLRTKVRKIKFAEGERIEIIMKSEKSVLSIHQASEEYGFPECGLRTIIKEGRIPVFKIRNRVYVTRKTMEEFLEQGGARYAG